ncbi:ribosome biogenesis GTPase YlqF [Massilicoli timonensis]|uniref:ribosome biogenesis GTPase YlqF n=1 Tax=Massilicoli timonensis TaxID=2015901 RepID=UPI0015B5D90D
MSNDKSFTSPVINWFPGHMTKAKRAMEEKLKVVDMVIELRDARVPHASANPLLSALIGNKPRLVILSKADKADPVATKQWVQKLSSENVRVLAFHLQQDALMKPIVSACKELMKDKIERQIRRGIKPRAIRVMVAGIPNVGKSTLINRLANKKIAQTGDRPGVTKALQWVKVGKELELLDTPGVLWPKFEDAQVGFVLGITGAINDNVLPMEELAVYALRYLKQHYPHLLQERYGIGEELEDPYQMLIVIAKQRGFLLKNEEMDEKRTVETLMREIRDEKIGMISWESSDGNSESV